MSDMPEHIQKQGEEATKVRDAVLSGNPPPAAATPPPAAVPPTPPPAAADAKKTLEDEIAALTQKRDQIKREIDTQNGQYGQRIQKLQSQVENLTQQLASAMERSAELTKRLAEKAGDPNGGAVLPDANAPDFKKIVGDAFMAQYGSELPEGVMKVVKAIVQPLQEELAAVRAESKKSATEGAANALWDALKAEGIQDPKALNNDPDFWEFLETKDPETDELYRDMAQDAIQRGNVRKVATVMKRFLAKQNGSGTPPPATSPPGTPPPESAAAVKPASIADEAAPKTVKAGGNAPPPPPGEKPDLTWAAWDAFQREVVQFPNRYSVEAINRRNDEFRAALREGKLR